jgi:spermidine synthase
MGLRCIVREREGATSAAGVAPILAARHADGVRRIDDASHFAPVDAREQVASALERLLERQTGDVRVHPACGARHADPCFDPDALGREPWTAPGRPNRPECLRHLMNEAKRPSNLQILAYEDSPLGSLCLRRRELLSAPGTVVTEVTLNHAFLMSSYNTASERALARIALGMHSGTGLRVLVGGLGLGYTVHAALESERVASVQVDELLPPVIEWLEQDLVPLSAVLRADDRFRVAPGDVYARLAGEPRETFDLILIDVDHAPHDQLSGTNDEFYTRSGLGRARRHLAPGGVLGVWSYAESSPFAEALRGTFDEVRLEPVSFFNELIEEETTDWLFFAR